MKDIVDETLEHWRRVPFQWGESDCLLSIADYVLRCTGQDYGAPFRDTYCTELGALSHIKDAGGSAALIDASGLTVTDAPERGDILLCGQDYPIAALCTGRGVAMRLQRGVIEVDKRFVNIIKAWKVPQCRLSSL
ncbi:hypothetical protein [Rhizobium phage RHph_X2_24]|nr:hypothetical protein [Rhizobium phage RHph_X2_24]